MTTYFIYINLGLAVFYMLSFWPLKRFTFFSLNRAILLCVPAITMFIPTLPNAFISSIVPNGVTSFALTLDPVVVGVDHARFFGFNGLTALYILGFSLSLAIFSHHLFQLLKFIHQNDFKKENGVKLGIFASSMASFSFGPWIYINSNDEEEKRTIMEHEIHHVRLGHSLDHLYYGLLKAIFWFNPFIYAFQKLLKANHEFEVDARMIAENEKMAYIESVVKVHPVASNFSYANAFYSKSNLLNRLNMMTSKTTPKMYKNIYFLSLILGSAFLFVVSCSESNSSKEETPDVQLTDEKVYTGNELNALTVKPSYPGGMSEMSAFLGSEIKYPEDAKNNGIEGVVYVSFIVNGAGEITEIKLKKGVEPSLDQEALRAIHEMPKWIPGEMDGKKVSVEFVLPVSFKMA